MRSMGASSEKNIIELCHGVDVMFVTLKKALGFGSTPHPATFTTRIIRGNPKLKQKSFATIQHPGWGGRFLQFCSIVCGFFCPSKNVHFGFFFTVDGQKSG